MVVFSKLSIDCLKIENVGYSSHTQTIECILTWTDIIWVTLIQLCEKRKTKFELFYNPNNSFVREDAEL